MGARARDRWGESLTAYGLIAACALLVTLPLLFHGPSCGQDFDFHLQSWLAAGAGWHASLAGHLPLRWPHWLAAANYGAGEPRLVFYPPFSWTLGALLSAGLRWTLVPQAFTFLALLGAGAACYRLARRTLGIRVAAVAACVYLANPYLLFVAYERTAYGELLGAVTMPLVVLYALRTRPPLVRLALVIAVLWLTNAPAAVMGCYLLGLCACVAAVATRTVAPLGRGLAALVLGTGAASVYVLPAWFEQRWVEIARVTGPGMRVEDSFLFGHTGEAYHDQVLHTASSIAVLLLGAGLLACLAAWLLGRHGLEAGFAEGRRVRLEGEPQAPHLAQDDSRENNARIGRAPGEAESQQTGLLLATMAVVLLAVLLLQMPWSEPLWRRAPELRFLQFPWRWLLVAGLAATLALATLVDRVARTLQQRRDRVAHGHLEWRFPGTKFLAAALVLLAAWGAGRYAYGHDWQACDEEDNVAAQQALLKPPVDEPAATIASLPVAAAGDSIDLTGFEGTDEYTPAGAENGQIQQGLPAVRVLREPDEDEGDDTTQPNPAWQPIPSRATLAIREWTPEHKRFSVTTAASGYAVLRLMDYPAWRVWINGRSPAGRFHREDGLMTVPLEAGVNQVEVLYHATPDVYAGRALSLLSLGALVVIGRRRGQQR